MRSQIVRHAVLLTVIGALAATGCTGAATPATVAPKPAIVAPAQEKPATTTIAQAEKPGPDSECNKLTAADIKAITGQDVRPVTHKEFANVVQCGNYVTASGRSFLGVNLTDSKSRYASEVKSVTPDLYPEREDIAGVGDEAILFKGVTGNAKIRYLLARKGEHGVILMSMPGAENVTDDMLKQLLAKAISNV